jgi:glycosyltransferase involved in cell wall biosynthesis
MTPLRILDAGCHDGFVGSYLRDQFGEDIELYGIELHPDAAEKARERGYTAVATDMIENACLHFPLGSFDIIAAYEVVEHVPDVDRFLAGLEAMLKPDGQILVSTPDGCFGQGHNPHHLRALRSIDLADILRRRGRLEDMGVGGDGVTVAAYRPARKRGEIAVYAGPGWERWHPMDIATRGLGGSETAAYRLSEALSELGYVVTLYGECDQGMMRDVLVRDWRTFDPTEPRLAVISSRIPEMFDRHVEAEHKLLWVHDVDCGDRLTPERARKIDRILCLSGWHRSHLAARYPFAQDKLTQIRNGIQPSYFTGEPTPERECRVLYTSSPDRGLDILLELWPRVREQVPDAELIHTYAPVYDRIAEQSPEIGRFRDRIRELAQQDGVTSIGGLSQPKLAELMRTAMVWAHPSYSTPSGTPFMETSCIGAMEAQAAGCYVVASAWGALNETVQTGALIPAAPRNDDGEIPYVSEDAFVAAIVRGLTDARAQAAAQTEGPELALQLGWDGVGEMIAAMIEPAVHLAAA